MSENILGGLPYNELEINSVKITVIERGKKEETYYFPRQVSKVLGWDADGRFGVVAGASGSGTLSDATPQPNGTAAAGNSAEASRANHVHPTPFARATVASNDDTTETITPAQNIRFHKSEVTAGGLAGARKIVLATASRLAGDRVRVALNLPATSDIIYTIHNATADGTELYATVTDGVAERRVVAEFEYNGTAWIRDFAIDPA